MLLAPNKATKQTIRDKYGRTFATLRLSLTNSCNFGCTYCVESEPSSNERQKALGLTSKQLAEKVSHLHHLLDLEVIRLTGGEPTLYTDLVNLVAHLAPLGIPIKMTTNGFLMEKLAPALAKAGLTEINLSLDAIHPAAFEKITRRRGLDKVLNGVDASLNAGLKVKVNAVIMKGVNDQEILPLLAYSQAKNISIRYLELMRMGHLFSDKFDAYFFSQQEILNTIETVYPITKIERQASATANYWSIGHGAEFGIIANESEPFCHDCNRLRLDSQGNLYGCLSEDQPISIRSESNSQELLSEKLMEALLQKQPIAFKGNQLSMIKIGG